MKNEYLKQTVDKIKLKDPSITEVRIGGLLTHYGSITKEDLLELGPYLRDPAITSFILSNDKVKFIDISSDDALAILAPFLNGPSLRFLSIEGGDITGLKALSQVLISNNNIEHLSLHGDLSGEKMKIFATSLPYSNISTLTLQSNKLLKQDMQVLTQQLLDSSVVSLTISGGSDGFYGINDDSVAELIPYLKKGEVLYFDLSHNQLTDKAIKTLGPCLSTVNYLDLSFNDKISNRGFRELGTYLKNSSIMQLFIQSKWKNIGIFDFDISYENAYKSLISDLKESAIMHIDWDDDFYIPAILRYEFSSIVENNRKIANTILDACRKGNLDKLVLNLKQRPAFLYVENFVDELSRSLFHIAASINNKPIMQFLIEQMSNTKRIKYFLTRRDKNGETVIQIARKNLEMVVLLKKHMSDKPVKQMPPSLLLSKSSQGTEDSEFFKALNTKTSLSLTSSKTLKPENTSNAVKPANSNANVSTTKNSSLLVYKEPYSHPKTLNSSLLQFKKSYPSKTFDLEPKPKENNSATDGSSKSTKDSESFKALNTKTSLSLTSSKTLKPENTSNAVKPANSNANASTTKNSDSYFQFLKEFESPKTYDLEPKPKENNSATFDDTYGSIPAHLLPPVSSQKTSVTAQPPKPQENNSNIYKSSSTNIPPVSPQQTKPEPAKKSWHFDPAIKPPQLAHGKEYELIPAASEDIKKVVSAYQVRPVKGYDVKEVTVIYNPMLHDFFSLQMRRLQIRSSQSAFAPTWKNENESQWREKTSEIFEKMAAPHTDPDYPNVKLVPMWHGTNPKAAEGIYMSGYASIALTDPGFFGKGYYFTEAAEYAVNVYSKGSLILSWVMALYPYPVIDGDMDKLMGKPHYKNYDAHFCPVVPRTPDPNEVSYIPCKPDQHLVYTEFVTFESTACLPRYSVTLQPIMVKTPTMELLATVDIDYQQGNNFYVQKNYFQAEIYYMKAAEKGYPPAYLKLGIVVEEEYGSKIESQKWYDQAANAIDWFTKQALNKNSDSQNNLGICYEKGLGVQKNFKMAKLYYLLASNQGHTEAKNNLKKFLLNHPEFNSLSNSSFLSGVTNQNTITNKESKEELLPVNYSFHQ